MTIPRQDGAAPVRMDRDGAVGWRDIPLDGLTCYHRCVEAVLRGHGLDADAVTDELGGPVTDRLGLDGRPYLRLNRMSARWHIAGPGQDNWDLLRGRLDQGGAVVVWPDGYYWPGDVCEGRKHAHHHAVLAVGVSGDELRVLDIDADEQDGFARSVPVTADTQRACTRLLEVVPADPTRGPGTGAIVADSVGPVGRFAAAADRLADRWEVAPTRRLAHAADLWVLGDIQPQLYLFARLCERYGYAELAAHGFAAAAQAKKISLFLFALSRYKPRSPYDLCLDDFRSLAEKLRAVEHAASSVATGTSSPQAPVEDVDPWLWQRLESLSVWHFGRGLDPEGAPPAPADARAAEPHPSNSGSPGAG